MSYEDDLMGQDLLGQDLLGQDLMGQDLMGASVHDRRAAGTKGPSGKGGLWKGGSGRKDLARAGRGKPQMGLRKPGDQTPPNDGTGTGDDSMQPGGQPGGPGGPGDGSGGGYGGDGGGGYGDQGYGDSGGPQPHVRAHGKFKHHFQPPPSEDYGDQGYGGYGDQGYDDQGYGYDDYGDDYGDTYASGAEFTTELGSDRVLRVTVNVDGRVYASACNMGPILDGIRDELARWHTELHAMEAAGAVEPGMPPTLDELADMTSQATESAMVMAGETLLGQALLGMESLLGDTYACGFFDDLDKTMKDHSGDIKTGASIFAAIAAGSLLGPEAAKPAADLAGTAVDAAAGKKKAQDKLDKAKADPKTSDAAHIAEASAAKSTNAYHAAATNDAAKKGDPKAQAKIADLQKRAAAGDPAAIEALAVLDQVGDRSLKKGITANHVAAAGAAVGGLAALIALL